MVTEILLFVVTFLFFRFLSQCCRAEDGTGRRKNPPPCPRGIPLLGNMSVFLGCREPIYTVLQKLSEEHGDILGLTVCGKKFVVLGSSEAIREAFVRQAVDFAGRPYMFSVSLLTRKNCGIAFSDYSPAWMEHRKSAASALRLSLKQGPSTTSSPGSRSIAETTILKEVSHLVSNITLNFGSPFEPSRILTEALINTVCNLTFGCRYSPNDPEMEAFVFANHKLNEIFKPGHPLDLFPFLKIFPSKRMRTIQEIVTTRDAILQAQYREHLETFHPDNIRDITDAFLKSMKFLNENHPSDDVTMTEDHVIMSMWEIFAGGFESTFQTLRWALAYLVHYPKVQHRLQDELDNNMTGGFPTWNDRPRLPYLEATVLETLRHSSFSSLNGPHVTTCDTKLRNYDIPKGTTVLCNLWWVHHDPKNWAEPNSFRPEHFLDDNGKVFIPKHFMPFSVGARVCLGKQLATMGLFLYLGGILKHFTLESPPGNQLPDLEPNYSDPIRTIREFQLVMKQRKVQHASSLPA
ncbi:steroid 17-alpha-hydroxylase/17,20 lyase-like [Asterias amurensis]|uniref:steroid 17-alpha-hydroxylase/17,20 lyase-like n=1 Tax=Asterias amurensis TaxID=7602 RepID=UPI003AB606CA